MAGGDPLTADHVGQDDHVGQESAGDRQHRLGANGAERLPGPVVHLIGWPSLGLGVAALLRPRAVAEMLGLEPVRAGGAIRFAGWRELFVLAAFLVRPVPRSLWLFVGQDVCDLTAGGVALGSRSMIVSSRRRLRAGLAGYGLLAVVDTWTALRWGRAPSRTPQP